MFFRRNRCPIDRDTAAWIGDCAAWMVASFGLENVRAAELVLPTGAFFSGDGKTDRALAEHVFSQVKSHAGLEAWPCRLEAQDAAPEAQIGEFTFVRGIASSPLGTFQASPHSGGPSDRYGTGGGTEPVITYDPKLVDDPEGLIATFAHELAHYLFATVPGPPPGGSALEEFATDLGAIFLGFGIFTLNTSFRFEAFGDVYAQGWQTTGAGYLSGRDQAYALALFIRFIGADERDALHHLDARHHGPFKKCLKHVDRTPAILQRLEDAPLADSA